MEKDLIEINKKCDELTRKLKELMKVLEVVDMVKNQK